MRNIRFRIWDKSIKKWMFGYKELGGFALIGEITLMGELSRISLEKLSNDDYAIMQYTGLKDKNGKEIYEGDVVRISYPEYTEDRRRVFEVCWDNQNKLISCRRRRAEQGSDWPEREDGFVYMSRPSVDVMSRTGEIIGNIHEPPELLTNQ